MLFKTRDEELTNKEIEKEMRDERKIIKTEYGENTRRTKSIMRKLNKEAHETRLETREKYRNKIKTLKRKQTTRVVEPAGVTNMSDEQTARVVEPAQVTNMSDEGTARVVKLAKVTNMSMQTARVVEPANVTNVSDEQTARVVEPASVTNMSDEQTA